MVLCSFGVCVHFKEIGEVCRLECSRRTGIVREQVLRFVEAIIKDIPLQAHQQHQLTDHPPAKRTHHAIDEFDDLPPREQDMSVICCGLG